MSIIKGGRLKTLFYAFCFLLQSQLPVNVCSAEDIDLNGHSTGSKNFDDRDNLAYYTVNEVYPINRTFPESVAASTSQLMQDDYTDIFSPYISRPVGSWPEAVAIGDVNGDGKNDVVMTTSYYFDYQNDYHLFVFLQNDTDGLSAPVKYWAGNGDSVDIADLNNDGRNDVVVTASNAIGVFLQNANGTLAPMVRYYSNHSSFTNTYKVRTGDFNNDGLADIASIDWGTQSHAVDVYLQNSIGRFNVPVTYVVEHDGYDDLETGDINNDGLTDIVVMNGQGSAYDNFGVLTQNASGTFDLPVYYDLGVSANTQGVAVGDINNDSLNDIVVTYGGNRPSSFIAAFHQNDSQYLDAPVSQTSFDIPESAEIADVNKDGMNDIIVLHGGWQNVGVYFQGPEGSLNSEILYQIPYASHYNPHGLATGDFNSDEYNDIAIADYNHGLVVLYNNPGPVRTAGAPPVYYQALQAACDDAGEEAVIQSQAIVFNEDLYIELNKSVTLQGGYVEGYTRIDGPTRMKGTMIINNGTITIDNFVLEL